jgi:hypothetical protein
VQGHRFGDYFRVADKPASGEPPPGVVGAMWICNRDTLEV